MGIRKFFISVGFSAIVMTSFAEEGLWIPMLLQQYNIDIMQKEGLKLSAEDIYSINKASLKDAIVIFGGGCTGELISSDGLLLTNHHCGFGAIQSHSSVEKDYLSKGFWAMSREEELPNNGLKVTFLIRIEDVTKKILDSLDMDTPENIRDSIVESRISSLKKESSKNTAYKSIVKPFYYGNEYYMFIYQEYTDVRLVGAPPSSIGNYGEDFDNWIWPRHTGDFSLFRIYAGKDNDPAAYSPENTPYKSKEHLCISTAGVNEGDFTMVMGYPGTTNEYIIADEISYMQHTSLPKKIALRDARLAILDKYMLHNDTIRIMYAAKYRSISNAWKKWQGVIIGLESTDALANKRVMEDRFQEWAQASPETKKEFAEVLPALRTLHKDFERYSLVYEYSAESFLATEIVDFALDVNSFISTSYNLGKNDKEKAVNGFKNTVEGFFKNYNQKIDEETFATVLRFFYTDIDPQFHPDIFDVVHKKYKGDFDNFASETFGKSLFCKKESLLALLDQFVNNSEQVKKRISKDPILTVYDSFFDVYTVRVIPYYGEIDAEMKVLYRTYMRGLREMDADKVFYPDANFTMRVAFGKAEGYKPADGVNYEYYTTVSGIMEKYYSDTVNYELPTDLINLINKKDFGRWADKNGEMHVCFAASNHTSGGNSGSPILNGNGQLIGLNFDRNWEGTMSDIYYDVSICRNIAVDIRYVLFIIDKFAGAGYLINEMDIQAN